MTFRSLLTVAVLGFGLTACAGLTQSQWSADISGAQHGFDSVKPLIAADMISFKVPFTTQEKVVADEAAVDAELTALASSPVPVSLQPVITDVQTFINDLPPGSVSPAHLLEANAALATLEALAAP